MKISHFLLFTLTAVIWLLICAFQLSVVASLVLSFVMSPWFLFYTVIGGFMAIGAMVFWGGLNTVPSLLWRFRKILDTRIVEVEADGRKYAAQIRLIGNAWMYIDAQPGDVLCTAWSHEMSAHKLLLKEKKEAEKYLDQLAKEMSEGLKSAVPVPEVITTYKIINGERVKL